MEEYEKSSAMSSVPESQPFSGSILNHWDILSKCAAQTLYHPSRLGCLLSRFGVDVLFFLQQLYQTLTDYDIRFYMYEILKVSF